MTDFNDQELFKVYSKSKEIGLAIWDILQADIPTKHMKKIVKILEDNNININELPS